MAQFSVLSVLFITLPVCFAIYYEGEEFIKRSPKDLTGPEYDRPVYVIFTSAEEYDKYTSILEDAGIRALDVDEGSLPELKVIISDGAIHEGLRQGGFLANVYPSLAAMVTMFVTSMLKIPWMLMGAFNSTTTTTPAPSVVPANKPRPARYIHFSNEDAYNADSLPIDPLPLSSLYSDNHRNTLFDLLQGNYPSSTYPKTYRLPAPEGDFHFVTKLGPQSTYANYESAQREPLAVPVIFVVPYPVPYAVFLHLQSEPGKNTSKHTDNNFPVRVADVTEKNETIPAKADTLNVNTPVQKAS